MNLTIPRDTIVEIVKSAAEEAELSAAEQATLSLTAEQETVLAFGQYAIGQDIGSEGPRCECPLVASRLIVNAPPNLGTPLDRFTVLYDRAVRSHFGLAPTQTSGRLVIA